MKPFPVFLTDSASIDVREIFGFIAAEDSRERANDVLDHLQRCISSLSENPNRGSFPPELDALGIKDYRQILYKPYRIIYRVFPEKVVVFLVADGRRDLNTLLLRRLVQI